MHARRFHWLAAAGTALVLPVLIFLAVSFSANADGIPVAAFDTEDSGTEPLIGETFTFKVNFDNSSPTTTGYGPYIDLFFPLNGADGNAGTSTADGIDFEGATLFGITLVSTEFIFPYDGDTVGCVNHPYAKTTTGTAQLICGTTGDKLVVLQLPYGSFVPGQPGVDVDVSASVSSLADANFVLPIQSRGGFRYGNDPLENPTTDPSIIGTLDTENFTPTLFRLSKTYNGSESEVATGPNSPRSYTLRVDVADGQTITNLDLQDKLDNNVQFLGSSGASPGGSSITDTPSTSTPANAPNNNLIVRWPSITGGPSANDASYNLSFFVTYTDADGLAVIPTSTGANVTSVDDASVAGTWTPTDVRDAPGIVSSDASPVDHTLNDSPFIIEKSVAMAVDTGPSGFTPGDTVEYTIHFSASDFFAIQDFVLNDNFSDGALFHTTSSPTFSLTQHGTTSSGSIAPANYTVTHNSPGDGSTTVQFRLSDELVTRALDPTVLGGCVPDGGGTPNCSSFNGGLTYGTITFRTRIQTTFTDTFPSGNPNVDQADIITNDASSTASVLFAETLTDTGSNTVNGTDEDLSIITGGLTQKSIYAINGNTVIPSPVVVGPGDTVTYRLQATHPTSNMDSFSMKDYLPLPVFSATTVSSFSAVVSAAVPAAGTAKFGPTDTFFALSGITPILTSSALENSVTFDYGTNITNTQTSSVLDVIFTVTISDQPFEDGLFLTNQANSQISNTFDDIALLTEIVQIKLNEPAVNVTKGVVASNATAATFSPTTVGPVTFTSPSSSCPRYSGTINSGNLDTSPIGSNVSGIDGSDKVTFGIVLENTGNSIYGAFQVQLKDVLPTGFAVPTSGLNVCVTDGTGATKAFTDLGGGLLGSGIQLTDTSSTQGALRQFATTTGLNVAIITYDLVSTGTLDPGEVATNTVHLMKYSATLTGPDFIGDDLTDSAQITTALPTIDKTIFSTNATTTSGNSVVVGELITYEIVVTVPQATSTAVVLTDVLDLGLGIVTLDSITASSSVATTHAGGFAGVLTDVVVSNGGRNLSFPFDTITNSNTSSSQTEKITIRYTVAPLNTSNNNNGDTRNNAAVWTWSEGSVSDSAPNVTIREPSLNLAKSVNPSIFTPGSTITFTMTVTNASTSTASSHGVSLADTLPSGTFYVTSSLVNVSGVAATLDDSSSTHLVLSWGELGSTSSSVVSYQISIPAGYNPGAPVTNSAVLTWSSLPGDVTATQSTFVTTACERTGNSAQTCGTTQNDYRRGVSVSATVFNPTITKSIVSTTEAFTAGSSVTIGEGVRYRVRVVIPESTSSTVVTLSDTLDSGLALQTIHSLSASSSLATSVPGGFPAVLSGAVVTSSGALITFDFGNLTNSDAVTSTVEYIELEYTVLVLNTSGNQTGGARNNSASWVWSFGTVTASASNVSIVEPVMTHTLVPSTSTPDGGDTVTFTMTVNHSGTSTADAFEADLHGFIPAGFVYVPASLMNVSGNVATLNDTSSTDLIASWATFGNGSSSVVSFQATVASSTSPQTAYAVTSRLRWTTLVGDISATQSIYNTSGCERTGNQAQTCGTTTNDNVHNQSSTLTVPAVTLTKALSTTSQTHTTSTSVVIGETATFSISVLMPEGTASSLNVTDVLPPGLSYVVSSAVVSSTNFNGSVPAPVITGGVGSGGDLTLAFGSITNVSDNVAGNDTFQIFLEVLVVNEAGNQSGVALNNQATGTVNGTQSITGNISTINVREPSLVITKSASVATTTFDGTVNYTLTLSNATGSNADAFEITLNDLIPSGQTFVTSSLTVAPGWTSDVTGNPLLFTTPFFGTASSSAIFTYQTTIAGTTGTTIGASLVNHATTTWTSLPGVVAGERTGAGGVNDYNDDSSASVLVTGVDYTVTKSDGSASFTASSTIAYTLNYSNTGNTAGTGVVVHETVPVGTVFNTALSSATWSCANGSPASTVCNYSIGTLAASATSSLFFAVTALRPIAAGLESTTNTVSIDDDGTNGVESDTSDNDDVETTPFSAVPDLHIEKTDSTTSSEPGDLHVYTITYANHGSQVAQSVSITDTVPINTTFSSASSSVGWTGCVNGSTSGTVCTYSVGSLAPGVTTTIQIALLMNNPFLAATTQVINTATIADDGSGGTDPTPGDNTATDTNSVPASVNPEYSITITDGQATIGPGGSLTYTVVVTNNGIIGGTGIVVTSTVPGGTSFGSATMGGTLVGSEVVWPGTSLAGGGTTLTYNYTVSVSPSATGVITADATIRDDGANGPESTLTNNQATDTTSIVSSSGPGSSYGGGGGGCSGSSCSTPTTSTPPIVIVPPQQAPLPGTMSCTVGCSDMTYELFIVNPDGSQRRSGTEYVKVELQANGTKLYRFEDKGLDFDYNDVLIEVDDRNCRSITATVGTTNARWNHQVWIQVRYKGYEYPAYRLAENDKTALGNAIVYDPNEAGLLCVVPKTVCSIDCIDTDYRLYIINPNGVKRELGGKYVKTKRVGPKTVDYMFEDKGDDMDFNDVVVRVNSDSCRAIQFHFVSLSAGWHHQVRAQLLYRGKVVTDTQIWGDTHSAANNDKVFDITSFPAMCSASNMSPAPVVVTPPSTGSCRPSRPLLKNLVSANINEDVRILQTSLKCLGYFPADVEITDKFGATTRAAVIAFQKAKRLSQVGVAGPATRALLNALP